MFHLVASIWFVDDCFVKNKNFYKEEIDKNYCQDTKIYLFYGKEFFKILEKGEIVWQELISYLEKYKTEKLNNDVLTIPDFGSSEEIYNALLHISKKHWNKLLLSSKEYDLLRKELFCSGDNFERAKKKLNF